MDDPTALAATVGPSNLPNRGFVDHRGAPYLMLLVWLVVLGAAFGVGLEYVEAIESDPDCSWDTCIQPFVGPLLWLLVAAVMIGGGYLAAVAAVALLEFSGPAGQRARFWVASIGPGLGLVGFLVVFVGAALP
jgi:hypothetical protein